MTNENAKREIREAVRKLIRKPAVIRILPSLPEFKYVFTCHHCSSHTYTVFPLSDGWGADAARICSVCGNMGNEAEMNWDRDMAWRHKWKYHREACWPR